MGTHQKPRAMVVMVNGNTYPMKITEAEELTEAMSKKEPTWSFKYERDNSIVTLKISNISSVLVWERYNGDR